MITGRINKAYWVFFLFLALRVIAFLFSKNYDGDAVLRVGQGINWLENPFFVCHANPVTWVFGPLQHYLIGLALSIHYDILYSPRFVNLILGSLSFFPFYGIVRLKLGEKTALYATILFSFYTLHIKYSTVATSEAISVFILLTAIYFFFRYESDRKFKWLLITAVFMNLGAMIRHDTPLFVAVLVVMLFVKNRKEAFLKNLSRVLLFGIMCLLFTTVWYWGDYQNYGDPLYSIHTASSDHRTGIAANILARGDIKNWLYNLAFWPTVVFLSLSPLPALLALIGFFRSVKIRKTVDLAILFLIPYLVYNYQSTLGASMTPLARFAITFTIFLIPIAAAEWQRIYSWLPRKGGSVLNWAIMVTVITSSTLLAIFGVEGRGYIPDKLSSVSPLSRLPYYMEDVLRWTDKHAGPEDKLVIDSYGFQSDVIKFYSRQPKDNIKIRWRDDSEILEYLKQNQPKHVIYSPEGRLKPLFDLNPRDSLQSRGELDFRLRFTTRHYWIYELSIEPLNSDELKEI